MLGAADVSSNARCLVISPMADQSQSPISLVPARDPKAARRRCRGGTPHHRQRDLALAKKSRRHSSSFAAFRHSPALVDHGRDAEIHADDERCRAALSLGLPGAVAMTRSATRGGGEQFGVSPFAARTSVR